MNKKSLIEVFVDTREKSNSVFKGQTDELIKATKVYKKPADMKLRVITERPIPATFSPVGTVSAGISLVSTGRTAILNFADAIIPGGFPDLGAPTQEEDICRCSNLYEALISGHADNNYYKPNKASRTGKYKNEVQGHVYTDRVMYNPGVTVFKDDVYYSDMNTPVKLDVITCPAPSCDFLTDNHALMVYTRRITGIIKAALDNGTENIVLGAWGCGAFGQSPILVAKAFAEVLNHYGSCFKNIVFAIRPSVGAVSPSSTYTTFMTAFNEIYRGGIVDESIW